MRSDALNPHPVVEVKLSPVTPVGKPNTNFVVLYDAGTNVKSWGRRGVFWGGLTGMVLGVALVAILLTSKVLTFGILGTLIVVTVECAVIVGVSGAIAGALYGTGVRRGETIGLSINRRALRARRQVAWIAVSDWPTRQYPDFAAAPQPEKPLQNDALSLPAIDAWEHGNTGP
jgi:hypothetical protein